MRAIVTGQVGMDKKHYVESVAALGGERGEHIDLYHIGDRMYAEAMDVRPGHILDLPLNRLHTLRRSVFKDIITESADRPNIIVNTHATFRWRHGLFRAFDFDQIEALKPDLFLCLVDNIESVYYRLHKEHTLDATLKDLMVWREEEIMATELLAQAVGCGQRFYIMARGRESLSIATTLRMITQPTIRKVYPSFPMTHVVGLPDVLAEIDRFRAMLAKHFITFDPADVDEKLLLEDALSAVKDGRDFVEARAMTVDNRQATFNLTAGQVLDIAGDIDGQIYARDFKLIDQADMIVSLVPELPDGSPGLSSGVERELQHAFEASKDVYVIWKPTKTPSPFITETATRLFRNTDEAMAYCESNGLLAPQANLFGH